MQDKKLGFEDNATVGSVLADHPPGAASDDPRTGAGPTLLSSDGNTLEYSSAFPREWAELYSNWNATFVANFPDFPYHIAILLLPSVRAISELMLLHHRPMFLLFCVLSQA